MNQLLNTIGSFVALTNEEAEAIVACLETKYYEKGNLVMKEGEISDKIFFVEKGMLREFYYLYQDQDLLTTSWIVAEGGFAYNIESFESNTPAQCQIEALEATKVSYITKQKLEELYKKVPQTEKIVRVLTQKYLLDYDRRTRMLRATKPEIRLLKFEKYYPELKNRLPIGVISSYLSIHISTLSKIRSKRAKKH